MNAILLGFILFLILYIVKTAKFRIVKMIVQNVIQMIIVKNFLMEIILDNAFVSKAISMICKIAFVKNVPNFGKIIIDKLFLQ